MPTSTTSKRTTEIKSSKKGQKAAVKGGKKAGKGKSSRPPLTAETADKHLLYQGAVQNVAAEIDFVDAQYKKARGKRARLLREDFCGTGHTSCEWVRRREDNEAFGLDIHGPTLRWGIKNNVGSLTPEQKKRVHLLQRDVREPGEAVGVDCLLAMNFSYWLFQERQAMIDYLKLCRESLADDGIFFMDFYGGSEAMTEVEEPRECERTAEDVPEGHPIGDYTYVWDQHKYNPITGEMKCFIHFEFEDGSKMPRAFNYTWRLWTLPEMLDVLRDAGFPNPVVFWEGDELDEDGEPTGEGDGVFKPAKSGDPCESFICYIVCEK